jgi:hypothetical protein
LDPEFGNSLLCHGEKKIRAQLVVGWWL